MSEENSDHLAASSSNRNVENHNHDLHLQRKMNSCLMKNKRKPALSLEEWHFLISHTARRGKQSVWV